MKKQVSSNCTQLTLNFEYEATTTAPISEPSRVEYHFSKEDFEESQAIEHDIMYGRGAYLYQKMSDKLVEHKQYIHSTGEDLPEIVNWKWSGLK